METEVASSYLSRIKKNSKGREGFCCFRMRRHFDWNLPCFRPGLGWDINLRSGVWVKRKLSMSLELSEFQMGILSIDLRRSVIIKLSGPFWEY